MSVLEKIRELLGREGVEIREVHHPPTRTSEEAAEVRGEELRVGGKALVLKSEKGYGVFVFSAARKLDSRRVRRELGAKRLRFATKEELAELTGLVPGSVPPFGEPLLPLPLYADPSVLDNERIAFNAGSLTDSVIMSAADWQRIAKPRIFPFAKAE